MDLFSNFLLSECSSEFILRVRIYLATFSTVSGRKFRNRLYSSFFQSAVHFVLIKNSKIEATLLQIARIRRRTNTRRAKRAGVYQETPTELYMICYLLVLDMETPQNSAELLSHLLRCNASS